jgi:hypothetical protein
MKLIATVEMLPLLRAKYLYEFLSHCVSGYDFMLTVPDFGNIKVNMNTYVRFEVFTAVTVKNVVFWDVTLCVSCNNRRDLVLLRSVCRLLVTASVVPS